jgi:hypothetical protein
VDHNDFTRLKNSYLRQVVHPEYLKKLLVALESEEIIVRDASYRAGEYSMGYKLHKRFADDYHVRVDASPKFIRRAGLQRQLRTLQEIQAERRLPIHNELDAHQHRYLTVCREEAAATLEMMTERACQDSLVQDLVTRSLSFSVSSTMRVFNSLTGVRRELRPALRIDGEHMGSVDLVCAQPALLAMLMTLSPNQGTFWAQKCTSYKLCGCSLESLPLLMNMTDDVREFCNLTTNGGFYETLVELSGMDRAWVKQRFLCDILAPRHSYDCLMRRVFEKEFPTVADYIRRVNHKDHGTMIRALQRAESWLAIEQVCPKLVSRIPTISLHDSIFSSAKNIGIITDAFNETFEQIGFKMSLKAETWDTLPSEVISRPKRKRRKKSIKKRSIPTWQ